MQEVYLTYIEKDGITYLKVGSTSNWSRRKHQYKKAGYGVVSEIFHIPTKSHKKAIECEDALRDYFIEKYNNQEWCFCPKDRFMCGYCSVEDYRKTRKLIKSLL